MITAKYNSGLSKGLLDFEPNKTSPYLHKHKAKTATWDHVYRKTEKKMCVYGRSECVSWSEINRKTRKYFLKNS